jgi:hypothetical protein
MTKQPEERLRGMAAYNAAKEKVAQRNEAAYARGREERAQREAQARDAQMRADRREDADLPSQPEN